jgi:magnesium transporter
MRAAVEEGLTFEEETAGRIMQREVVAIPQFWTVGKTLDYLRALQSNLPEEFYDIFVVDPMYHVVGEVPLSAILRAARTDKLHELARDTIHTIAADTDQEDVAMRFRRDNLTSAPVVDDDGRLLGVVTVDDVVNVIDREAEEDVLKLAGLSRTDLYRAAFGTARSRFSWLFINLLTAILASAVISMFEASIDQIVALAVLMPIVASMGGNAGTQALTVAVRSLATNELSAVNAWRIIGKETLVGLLNGIAFAAITGVITWAWFADPLLGGVIAGAMIFNLIAAGLAGVGIPVLLNRIGIDPAVASTVFVTTITDVLGFFLFLGLAGIVLL